MNIEDHKKTQDIFKQLQDQLKGLKKLADQKNVDTTDLDSAISQWGKNIEIHNKNHPNA